VSAIASKVDPGLVDVNSTFAYQEAAGAGTGMVLSSNGIVLTNNHVINGATSIRVTDIGNGRTYPATVIGYDKAKDVAVLQLQGASGLRTVSLGNSASARPGLPVVAIGNAGGVGGAPSTAGGSITALDQSITASDSLDGVAEHLTGMIQTNADIVPGDSGGPLVDTSGQVLGMDTAAASGNQLQAAISQGYAIPINEAMSIAHSILAGDSTASIHVGPTAFLGVLISSSSQSANPGAFVFGGSPFSQTPQTVSGATVAGVIPGYAAANAGLGTGDVITAINGQAISSPSALSRDIASEKPGQSVSLTWTTPAGQTETATVTLTAGPPA
jgi:S1-C subfamily serine protease